MIGGVLLFDYLLIMVNYIVSLNFMQWENNVSYFSSSIEYETFLLYVEVCFKSPKSLFFEERENIEFKGGCIVLSYCYPLDHYNNQ